MIQPLRTVHRRVFVALAFFLPAVLLAGLGARRQPGGGDDSRVTQLPASLHLVKRSASLWQKHPLQSDFYSDRSGTGQIEVVFNAANEFNEPDLLLYWSQDEPQADSLPPKAQLLGSFVAGNLFHLPSNSDSGYLVLYSLPHQTVFDTARVEKLP